jgi:hypothetical protein
VTRYYRPEHEDTYRRIELEGRANWDHLQGGAGSEDFSSRRFLERIMPTLGLVPAETDVLRSAHWRAPASHPVRPGYPFTTAPGTAPAPTSAIVSRAPLSRSTWRIVRSTA